jgi:hypothetical protein
VRRPPNRKTLVAAMLLLVAAAVAFARPAVGEPPATFLKQLIQPAGF